MVIQDRKWVLIGVHKAQVFRSPLEILVYSSKPRFPAASQGFNRFRSPKIYSVAIPTEFRWTLPL